MHVHKVVNPIKSIFKGIIIITVKRNYMNGYFYYFHFSCTDICKYTLYIYCIQNKQYICIYFIYTASNI